MSEREKSPRWAIAFSVFGAFVMLSIFGAAMTTVAHRAAIAHAPTISAK